jgi:tartrate/fumarate subfamily iron-sulfur-dependent hydro-lyase beta chain
MDAPIRHLTLPLDEDEARSLRLGEMVTVTGAVFTGRSRFHIRAVEEGILPPIDFDEVNCREWQIVAIEPTSSIRFERYGADVVRALGLRTLIGKTTMGPRTAAALAEVGGVYLSKIGICGNLLASQVTRVREAHFVEELGKTEATWVFEVERFGPFFVAIDAQGNSYFEDLDAGVRSRISKVERALEIPEEFEYTNVNASSENR